MVLGAVRWGIALWRRMGLGGWGSKPSERLGIRQAEGLEVAGEEGIPGKQTLKPLEPQSWKGCVCRGEAAGKHTGEVSIPPSDDRVFICPV